MKGRLERVVSRVHGHRLAIAFFLYAGIVAVAYTTAFLFRFEFRVPARFHEVFWLTLAPLIAIRLAAFHALRLTQGRWRYASVGDAGRLAGACLIGSLVFYVLFNVILADAYRVPLSILWIEGLLTCWLIAAVWLGYRVTFEYLRRGTAERASNRALIIGAGEAGNLLAREMLRSRTGYTPAGFVDDDPKTWGTSIQGLRVIGSTSEMAAIARATNAECLVIAVPSASPGDLRRIVERCKATGLEFKVLPGIADVIAGHVKVSQLRDVRIEDLLGREPISLQLPELSDDLRGCTVLITGAAGSIGSELSRQVAVHAPDRLLILDQAESDLFFLELDLRRSCPDLEIVPLIADITDASAIEHVFRRYSPDRVFHAAAYKHVPMMESNVREAIRNNVIGTWRVADAAGRFGAEKFVLVSTDKAVRPSNVMGASKRLAELTILELQQRFSRTTYGAVRFGNVLGSNGSVIPVFKRQLSAGLPLTVTHPETTRYFMTIPEAVQLILQASLLPQFRGHIAMLEMGSPVRIADLAFNLLRLSGVPDTPDRVVFTGLRPGEKLHEELSAPDEDAQATEIQKVTILRTTPLPTFSVASQIRVWDTAFLEGRDDAVLRGFFDVFPELQRSGCTSVTSSSATGYTARSANLRAAK